MLPYASAMLLRQESAGGGSAPYGSHRYWRLSIPINSGDAGLTSVTEIEFRGSVGGADLTGAGTALSGGSGSDGVGTSASGAFDNSSSLWQRSSATDTWIGYDFGTAVAVAEVAVTGSNTWQRSPGSFTLDWSDDGSSWTVADTFTCYGWLISAQQIFPPATPAAGYHRFWRVFCTNNNGGSSFTQIGEIEFRATAGGADQTSALPNNDGNSTGRVVGSSITVSADEGYKAFTNSAGSVWFGAGTTNQWVGYIFPSPVTVQQAMIQAGSTSGNLTRQVKDGTVDWSDDGISWTSAGSFTKTGWTVSEQLLVTVTP